MKDGFILVVALWILAFLSLLSLGFGQRTHLIVKMANLEKNRLSALYLNESAFHSAISTLASDKNSYDSPFVEEWAKSVIKENWLETEGEIGYTIIDEERRLNLNTISLSSERMKKLPEISEELIDSVLDWRDPDNEKREDGAEEDYYQGLNPSYHCKNGPFSTLDELLLVKGMTPDIFLKWKDLFTLSKTDGRVNINSASSEVLRSTGLKDEKIIEIIDYRELTPIEELDDIPEIPGNLYPLLKTSSQVFTILCKTNLKGFFKEKEMKVTVEREIIKGEGESPQTKFKILSWQED